MKKNTKVLCAVVAVILAVSVAYAAVGAGAGSANDPLVTLSYLTGVFAPKVEGQMDTLVDQKADELTKQFDEAIGRVNAGSSDGASVFSVVTLTEGQLLVGDVGCEVMLRVGSAVCVSDGSTGLIDVTDGSTLGDGKNLVKNHLYMVTISTRTVKAASGTVKVLVRGPYSIV